MGKRLIGSVGLKPGTDTGFDLDEKGQIHGYTDTQFALPVGDDNQVLTSLASEASGLKWATASSGSLELIEDYTEGSATANSKDFDITEDPDDFSCLILEYSIGVDGAGDLNMQINSSGGAGEYESNGSSIVGGSQTLIDAASTSAEVCPSEILSANDQTGCGRITIYLPEAGTARSVYFASASGQNTARYYQISGVNYVANTSITKINLSMSTNNWKQNSNFTLYRMAK
tara:strand:+ start:158 stop:847 length:690 start_codon:yes stop_codon:yes gene_type:complete